MSDSGLLTDKKFGPFSVAKLLGQGGMGEVYFALDEILDRPVALKVLRTRLARDPGFVERFLREARAAAKLNHPNIVQVYAVGELDGIYYISMELIRGASVAEFIHQLGRLEVGQVLRVARHAGQALVEAHQQGIVHRDIKPANLMVDQTGRVKVMDFGLAKEMQPSAVISGDGVTVGTPYYMAPELLHGDNAGPRSDFYALGVTMYEMLAGRPPYDGESLAALMRHIDSEPFPDIRAVRPDVPQDVARIISRLTAKRPEARYASAETIVADVRVARDAFQKSVLIPGDPFLPQFEGAGPGIDLKLGLPEERTGYRSQVSRIVSRRGMRFAIAVTLLNLAICAASVYWRSGPAAANRALEWLERGLPAIEALEEAHAQFEAAPTEENKRIAEDVRRRFLAGVRMVLHDSNFQPAKFTQACSDIQRAIRFDPASEIETLYGLAAQQWHEYGLTLSSIDSANNAAIFRLDDAEEEGATEPVQEGGVLHGRFIVRRVTAGSIVLEDTKIANRVITALPGMSLRGSTFLRPPGEITRGFSEGKSE